MGEAMEDEDRNMLYKLELVFPELPNTRMIKLSFKDENKLLMRMSEMPNERIAEVLMKELNGTNPKMSAYMSLIEKRIGKNVAAKRLTDTFAPALCGARVGCEQYESIMAEESRKNKLLDKTARIVNSVVYKLMHEEDDDSARGFIGEIVDRIKIKMPKRLKGKVYTASGANEANEAVIEKGSEAED